MKALVVGGTGFLGRNLCEYLEKLNTEVDIFNRKSELPLKFPPYDFIFFLAGEVRKQADMFYTHVELLYKVLARSLQTNCVFVYVGSSSEYGRMDEPMTEECPISPTNLYEATKGMGTLLCQGFAREFDRPIVIVRPSSVYGKYERPEKLIPTIIRKIQNKEKIDIYRGLHDWIHVDDFIEGMMFAIVKGKMDGEIYNISSGRQHSNLEVALTIWGIIREDASMYEYKYHDEYFHKHDTDCWVVDNSKLVALGWESKYDLVSGLKQTVRAMEG